MSETTNGLAESPGITNPLVLVQSMIERGADPDALKKMMDLAERFQANQALKAFNVAMQAAQAEMPVVVRDKENTQKNNMYATLEAVSGTVKAIYTRHGFTLSFAEVDGSKEGFAHIVCDVRHVDGHEKRYDGFYPLDGKGAKGGDVMNPLQGRVSTMTYAKRDLKVGIFDITIANQDNDGESSQSTLSDAQVGIINDHFAQCREAGKPIDVQKFLKWVASFTRSGQPLETIADALDRDFEKIVSELIRVRNLVKKGAAT